MQQLATRLVVDGDQLKLLGVPWPELESDRLESLIRAFVVACDGQWVEMEFGADRVLVYFRVLEQDCLLSLESLCEAAWIEAVGSGYTMPTEHILQAFVRSLSD